MISELVSRYPGDKQGEDIIDPLITSPAGARIRGYGEIDEHGYDRVLVTGTGPLRADHIEPGALVENMDTEQQIWRGVVKRAAITLSRAGNGFAATMALEIDRVDNED